jgi:hypothetical protein
MDLPALARALGVLNENAGATLRDRIVEPIEETHIAQRALVAQTAYGVVLAQIADAREGGCWRCEGLERCWGG